MRTRSCIQLPFVGLSITFMCVFFGCFLMHPVLYQRDDHKDFTECIQSLIDPEKKFETQNELFRIGAKEMAEKAKKYDLFSIMRNEESTVENTLIMLEKHFCLIDG